MQAALAVEGPWVRHLSRRHQSSLFSGSDNISWVFQGPVRDVIDGNPRDTGSLHYGQLRFFANGIYLLQKAVSSLQDESSTNLWAWELSVWKAVHPFEQKWLW